MSLRLVHSAAELENSDSYHIARLLILIRNYGARKNKPVQGIMKLAKMDFLLRYPNCLVRVLKYLGRDADALKIPQEERDTIEGRMIRFRYGPWDSRYRRWISILVSKGLAMSYLEGRTVNVKLTEAGMQVADLFGSHPEYDAINKRSQLISVTVGNMAPTKLKEFVYKVFPEILDMRWGKEIEI